MQKLLKFYSIVVSLTSVSLDKPWTIPQLLAFYKSPFEMLPVKQSYFSFFDAIVVGEKTVPFAKLLLEILFQCLKISTSFHCRSESLCHKTDQLYCVALKKRQSASHANVSSYHWLLLC